MPQAGPRRSTSCAGVGSSALPTDTVYGIAVSLDAPDGLERLFAAKGRPPGQGDRAARLGHRPGGTDGPVRAGRTGPGRGRSGRAALTLVVPSRPEVRLPELLTAGGSSIGLRLPGHGTPRALARALGPLPVTSRQSVRRIRPDERSGRPDRARRGDLDLVLDGGPAPGGTPSTVVRCNGWDAEDPARRRDSSGPDRRDREGGPQGPPRLRPAATAPSTNGIGG